MLRKNQMKMFRKAEEEVVVSDDGIFCLTISNIRSFLFITKYKEIFIHGVLDFEERAFHEQLLNMFIDILREALQIQQNKQISEIWHNQRINPEFYREFWKYIIQKFDENEIEVYGLYLDIVDDFSKIPSFQSKT